MTSGISKVGASAAFIAITSVQALGQWTATVLHPPAATRSAAICGSPGHLGGWVDYRAYLWTLENGVWIGRDLNPPGAAESRIDGSSQQQLAGYATFDGIGSRACVWNWNGSDWIWMDLHPENYDTSTLSGTAGTRQVGRARISAQPSRPGVWTGAPNSFVALPPSDAQFSEAGAIDPTGTEIVGLSHSEQYTGPYRAALWTWDGLAWHFVSLHPPGASESGVGGNATGQQAGWVISASYPNGGAAYWSGSATSWVSLHPPGMYQSGAFATSGNYQVGRVRPISSVMYAALWSGSAASRLDLHLVLPAGQFSQSQARGVMEEPNGAIYVCGDAFQTTLTHPQAVVWTYRPPCTGDLNDDLAVSLQDLAILLAHFGDAGGPNNGDLDGDGDVDLQDLANLLANFGTTCP